MDHNGRVLDRPAVTLDGSGQILRVPSDDWLEKKIAPTSMGTPSCLGLEEKMSSSKPIKIAPVNLASLRDFKKGPAKMRD